MSRSILTDARSTLSRRAIQPRSRFVMADRLAHFALSVDKLLSTGLANNRNARDRRLMQSMRVLLGLSKDPKS